MGWTWHKPLEGKSLTFTILTLLAILVGGLVELVPPYFLQGTIEPLPGFKPYSALELEGRDVYIREGCNNCHSQMVRPLASETARYGPFSTSGEGVYDRPFLWGSRRTGPDLSRVGGKYPDSWHWIHLLDPRGMEPRSNMPSYAFLTESPLDLSLTQRKLEVLRKLGHPYSDAEIASAADDARKQAEGVVARLRNDGQNLDAGQAQSDAVALIAFLQRLGVDAKAAANAAPAGGAGR
jgi:cytochrome c oxidase cbb3-type subunit I/II